MSIGVVQSLLDNGRRKLCARCSKVACLWTLLSGEVDHKHLSTIGDCDTRRFSVSLLMCLELSEAVLKRSSWDTSTYLNLLFSDGTESELRMLPRLKSSE